jgi:hypothetical protein
VSTHGRELISQALSERFHELCGVRLSRLSPETSGEMASFVSQVREQLSASSPADINLRVSGMNAFDDWAMSDTDCLSSLCALSLGEPLQLHPGTRPPLDDFIKSLNEARTDPERSFELLAERYSCPLNFTLAAEDEAREHILARLMTHDRARVEKNSIERVESRDLLLRLNLVGVHAARTPDLRFLDALNYYYELLPDGWQPKATQHRRLLISYFALYARALAAWI